MDINSWFLRTTYWLDDFFKGSPIRKQYRDIRLIMEDDQNGKKRRDQLLEDLLMYAVNNCQFYSHYDCKVLSSFPVTNKSILLKNYKDIEVSLEKIPLQKGNLHIQKTSGSTGMPFAIPQNTIKRNRRIAELKYFGQKAGFRSHDKLVHLRTWNRWQNKSKLQAFKENIIPFDIGRLNNEKLEQLCSIIKEKKVKALRGYASSIDLLARYAMERKIKFPSLRLVISGSEALQESTRSLVEEYLGCDIISQYANEENGILAQERPGHKGGSPFYLNHASYIFEVLKMNENEPAAYGELGRIVITDLFNYAFPVIRYDTGDTGILLAEDEFSHQYPVIEKLYGRRVDLVTDTKGEIVHPISFSRILKNHSGILQWQFIQKGKKDYLLKLITKENNFDAGSVRRELLPLFGRNANIVIEFVNTIPVLASGKRKPVVNKWKI